MEMCTNMANLCPHWHYTLPCGDSHAALTAQMTGKTRQHLDCLICVEMEGVGEIYHHNQTEPLLFHLLKSYYHTNAAQLFYTTPSCKPRSAKQTTTLTQRLCCIFETGPTGFASYPTNEALRCQQQNATGLMIWVFGWCDINMFGVVDDPHGLDNQKYQTYTKCFKPPTGCA
jgi:hypothetical protein